MKRIIVVIAVLNFTTNLLFATEKLFEQGNKYYAEEKYEDAILIYDSIQQYNFQSVELFYNIGNTYYKLQDWSNSILYYEKTLKLDPNHEDALYNLELTQLKIVDKIDPIPVLFFEKWINDVSLFLPFDYWAVLSIILIWAAFMFFVLRKITIMKLSNSILNLLVILSILSYTLGNSQFKEKVIQKNAIIFSSAVVIKSAPTFTGNDLFSLHAGSKITITDQIGNWIHIKLSNGNKGWMLKDHCKEI